MEGIGKIYLENGNIEPAVCNQDGADLVFTTYEGHRVLVLNEEEVRRILNCFGGWSRWIKSNLE